MFMVRDGVFQYIQCCDKYCGRIVPPCVSCPGQNNSLNCDSTWHTNSEI